MGYEEEAFNMHLRFWMFDTFAFCCRIFNHNFIFFFSLLKDAYIVLKNFCENFTGLIRSYSFTVWQVVGQCVMIKLLFKNLIL